MFAAEPKPGARPVQPSSLPSLSPLWKEVVEPVKPFLADVATRLSEQVDAFDADIVPYARYALINQGKQLRPVLVALSGGATGKLNDSLVTAAVIIEMVHLATLVHDDVVDEAELRRCRPTLAANWGNEISVLVGDCLFAQAVQLAASFPTPDVCRAVAIATNRVCSGEILQTQGRRKFTLTRTEYLRIIEMKTAELFALSCELGAALSSAFGTARQSLRQYGMALGTAYQIFDDCLDLFGTEENAGKSLGTDLISGKMTLPMLVALERATPEDREELQRRIMHWNAASLPAILHLLEKYDAQSESYAVIQEYLQNARNALQDIPESQCRAGLVALTEFLAQQTDALGVSP
jgi:octaprenyl-diphosphate synthase